MTWVIVNTTTSATNDMFETKRVKLRGYRPSDDEFFFSLFDEYPVLLNLTDGYILPDLGTHRARLDAMTHCLLFVVVENKETGEPMGFTLLAQRNALDRNAEIGVALSQKWWGQGFGTEVMNWLIQYSFSGLALNRLSLYVWSINLRAVTMYEHLGFEREGCIREAVWKEGRFVDKIYMGLLARDYQARYESENI